MRALTAKLEEMAGFGSLCDGLAAQPVQRAVGLAGATRSVLAASLFRRLHQTVLVVTASTRQAEAWYDDLHALLSDPDDPLNLPLRLFPSLPTLLYGDVVADRQLVGQRLDALEALLRGEPTVVVAPLSALLHRSIPPSAMAGSDLAIQVGDTIAPEALLERLEELGYAQHEPVLMPGQCAQRGGIVDVYPLTAPQPLRVEFWGDEIESIRFFDVNSQRSTLPQDRFVVTVSRESVQTRAWDAKVVTEIAFAVEHQVSQLAAAGRRLEAKRLRAKVAADLKRIEADEAFDGSDHYLPYLYEEVATLCDYLPPQAVVLVDEPAAVAARAAELAAEVDEVYRGKLATGAVLALPAPLYVRHEPDRPLWHQHRSIVLTAQDGRCVGAPNEVSATFQTTAVADFGGELDRAVGAIDAWRAAGNSLLVTTHQVGRLRQILSSRGVAGVEPEALDQVPRPGRLQVVDQRLSAGFAVPELKLVVLTDHELFGWHRHRTRATRAVARRGSTALASLSELSPGDTVVHVQHGIAVYRGMVTRTIGDVTKDYLQLDYAGTDRLYVPVTELDRVQRYLGPDGVEPTINGLGDGRWRRTTQKARKKAEAVARDLLELYARRSQAQGHQFAADTKVQHDMEAAFIYEETGDQIKAIDEIKHDMERQAAMDRLLVGDVGFGKTEVAVRAAFKAVQDGCQVAVLVPTTVLAQQHHSTFVERLSAFGCAVEALSRFRTRREQLDVIDRLRTGDVQVVVGTHRLLSEDIKFLRLGLLVIDEEHRFGVRHKDAIKRLKLDVDVLSMSATPIPRTLNSALIGVRDLSLLQEPPQGRLPVATTLAERTEEVVREAILRELDRDGQVYLLHNRVRTIERVATHLERIVPHAKVGIAHGQMAEDELEEVMVDMYAGRYDVLVCTTIIESGLDIPNANTILIDDCDQFGLAQLYQLIGRVGRRERQAYAYLLHRKHKELTDEATRRLQAIQELCELGSGFEIALRDLEIRGAGNLLGVQQSGFIEEVGFELYTQMLNESLRTLMGEGPEQPLQLVSELALPVQAHLPPSYVRDEKQRIDIYRRLSLARDEGGVDDLENEVRDRYGRPPAAAANLFRLLRLRMACDRAGVGALKVVAGGQQLLVDFAEGQHLDTKELRIFARGLQREAKRGGSPRLQLATAGLTADLREPRPWEVVDAAEALLRMVIAARAEVGAAGPVAPEKPKSTPRAPKSPFRPR